jgi:hypothetical protein
LFSFFWRWSPLPLWFNEDDRRHSSDNTAIQTSQINTFPKGKRPSARTPTVRDTRNKKKTAAQTQNGTTPKNGGVIPTTGRTGKRGGRRGKYFHSSNRKTSR